MSYGVRSRIEALHLFQVIDNFHITEAINSRSPSLDKSLAEGVWFILDAQQTQSHELPVPGQVATIRKPDGSVTIAKIEGAEESHSVFALKFMGLGKEDVPRLSEVDW